MSDQEPAPLKRNIMIQILQKSLLLAGGIFITLVIVSMLLPSLAQSGLSPRTSCGTNLSAIAKSCLTYSEGNRGALPPNLEILLIGGERAYMVAKQLVCPVSKLPYIYISSQRNNADPRNVVAYEPPSYHEGAGGNVAFLDGSVKWCRDPQAVVAETEGRIRGAATQPMH